MKICTLAETVVIARGQGLTDRRMFEIDRLEMPDLELPSDPAESLINALEKDRLALLLGLTVEQINERGEAWDAAIAAYNQGFVAEG